MTGTGVAAPPPPASSGVPHYTTLFYKSNFVNKRVENQEKFTKRLTRNTWHSVKIFALIFINKKKYRKKKYQKQQILI